MKSLITIIIFVLRHLLAVILAIILGSVLWAFLYFVLLVIAVVTNQGLGGPAAYPVGALLIIVGCSVIGWGVFAPACAVGALCCRVLKWRKLAAIPLVFVSGFFLSYLWYFIFVESLTTSPMLSGWEVMKNYTMFLSIPLGIYWWLTEGPGALIEVFRKRLVRKRLEKEVF